MIWLGAIGLAIALFLAAFFYLSWYLKWEARHTNGMAYYGQPLAARRALKRKIRWLSLPAKPIVRLLAPMARRQPMPVFEHDGVCGPPRVSSAEVFARAHDYRPQPEDVFVVTQMRCGTTWMQQIVYEIVSRGRGDFSDQGHGHLYATSPWIDGINSVSMESAPVVGVRPTRIIKSHLPARLNPFSEEARYVYVTRHPVSCFASIVDYNRSLLGPLTLPVQSYADWFCSDRMYWSPWPEHVAGWWTVAERHDNVLFVHFEAMKTDLASVIDRVSRLLDVDLTEEEKRQVMTKCEFRYMREHEEWFEMSPPTMFSVTGGRFMASGKASRHEDVSPAIRDQIVRYCRDTLRNASYPAERFYPDLTN